MGIQLLTIGFTQKTAEQFFSLLHQNNVDVVVDVRLRPNSQLSAFAKQRDLPYFLQTINGCDYRHLLDMAPTDEMLDRYRKEKDWGSYMQAFRELLETRDLIQQLDIGWWQTHRACLLCSEHEPHECHRAVVAEYLQAYWPAIEVVHLK